MNIIKKNLFIISLLLLINPIFAQISDESLKTNPMLELLGTNAKTLGLKGNVKEMQELKFSLDPKGNKAADSVLFNTIYKFDKDGLTKEFEENYKDSQSKKHFFSYTNKGYVSHIDIEINVLNHDKDTLDTKLENQFSTPDYSTIDYKYVNKRNILFKAEEVTKGSPKKNNIRNEYFYHFNDDNQIFQIDYQSKDLTTKYIYDSSGLVKEVQAFKSGVFYYKNIYKYDRNNRLTNIATFNPDNTTKYPNKETIATYKFDNTGNIIEKKLRTYLYLPSGIKEFFEGNLYQYNYSY